MQASVPELLTQFETETNGTLREFVQLFPKVLLFDKYQDSATIEVLEPIFPFFERSVLINGKMRKISFINYYSSNTTDDIVADMLKRFRCPSYINHAQNELNQQE